MFYYLLYNSSFSFIVDNRLFTTILYGSILYILTHAILNYCNIEILNIINNYFWIIFTLDIISFSYGIYQEIINPIQNNPNSENTLNVSFNLLKNKINTLLDRKNDLTITQTELSNQQQYQQQQYQPQTQEKPKQNVNYKNQSNNANHTNQGNNSNSNNVKPKLVVSENKFSTPISQLKKNNKNNMDNSTPITLIRNKNMIDIPEPIINEDINEDINDEDTYNGNAMENVTESIAGSDVGSVMDLDDFEKSL
jgi:hypothetical protein